MIVFKTFLKVLNKNKLPVIISTVLLIVFAGFNMQTSDNSTNFVASKPDVFIINQDEEKGITQNLIEYIKENNNIIEIENNEEAINDALFYRDVNYIIDIPQNYRQDFLDGKNPTVSIKTTGDYQASLAEMMLERYIKVANLYQETANSEEELIEQVNQTIKKQTEVSITSQLDTNTLEKATFYYNFTNYSMLAGCVYIICLLLASFKEEKIAKRTMISSTNYKKMNRNLLIANSLLAIFLWLFHVLLSFILVGDIMYTLHGLIYIINSFVFTLCAITIAFVIGTILNNKNAINGIINVVALGSSFLCGAFVPMQWLPDSVIKIAHILPCYYFIANNESIKQLETITFEHLKPILINMGIILLFAIFFVILTNIISKKKRKIG